MKRALRTGYEHGVTIEKTLATFLLQYRNTPHTITGVSLSSLLIGRNLRTHLDLLSLNVGARVQDQQELQKKYHDQHSQARTFSVG